MFPGFAVNYIDKNNYKHLYFFRGIDDNDEPIYNNIDLSNYDDRYIFTENLDGSIDYKFYDKSIVKIICKLVDKNNDSNLVILKFK